MGDKAAEFKVAAVIDQRGNRDRQRGFTNRSTMLGLLFLSVLTAWKTSTERWCWSISHTMLMAQNVPLRPPPFLKVFHGVDEGLENENSFRSVIKLQYSHAASRWRCFISKNELHSAQGCDNLQTVDHSASLAPIILFLPFVHLSNKLEEGAFGYGSVSVHGPTEELELLHHAVSVLRLGQCTIGLEK